MAAIANVKVIESMIEVDGVNYRKANRPVREGDIVKANEINIDITIGKFYAVESVDGEDFTFVDDDGDFRTRYIGDEDYEVYEKVTEAAQPESDELFTYKGNKYRKVKRKAAVGERILIVKECGSFGKYKNGDTLVVDRLYASIGIESNAARTRNGANDAGFISHEEYVVLEPVKSADPPKPATPPARIPVGSYVKITNGDDLPNGSIAKVLSDDKDWAPYKCELLDGSDYDYLTADDFEVLSEAEAKAAVEAEAERQKWAAIGREVNEYKRGDIVHYVCKNGSIGIGTVEDVGQHAIGVRNDIKTHSDAKYKGVFFRERDTATLIVPVEQRFDRTEAMEAAGVAY